MDQLQGVTSLDTAAGVNFGIWADQRLKEAYVAVSSAVVRLSPLTDNLAVVYPLLAECIS